MTRDRQQGASADAEWVPPSPNWQTRASFDDLAEWVDMVRQGRWSWTRNTACKYVSIRIDTRHGAHRLEDRDGNEISFADLRRQFGQSDQALLADICDNMAEVLKPLPGEE
jgi:hypothetical protein